MGQLATFHLPKWLEGLAPEAKHILGGSATPGLSLDDLVALSSDPAKTEAALQWKSFKLASYSDRGSEAVRQHISELYSKDVLPEHVVTTTGTTGANMTVFLSLLQVGDHVISVYPTYPQLLGLPKRLGCELSHWRLDPANGWRPDLEELRKLIKPTTKMIILNNPSNPSGFRFDVESQQKIIDIARQHDIYVLADEIFRPLYHGTDKIPGSLVELEYPKVIVTSSMSKVWGMASVRIGWIISRDRDILESILNGREYTLQNTSLIDETIATEALSPRCRHAILKRHLGNADQGLQLLDAFVKKNSDLVSWTKPTAAATAFIKFNHSNGEAVDDVEFCRQLLKEQGLLLTPGSLGFGDDERQEDFRGYVRIQFTLVPKYLQEGLELLDAFLENKRSVSS